MFCQTYLTRVVTVFALQIALCLTVPANAALIGFASGNTNPGNYLPPGVDGTINFGILNTTGGAPGDTFGTGVSGFDSLFVAGILSPTFDTSASYLYLFQPVNNGINTGAISLFSAQLGPGLYSSFGTFTAVGFTDLEGDVSASNIFGPGSPTFGSPDPASLGVTNPGITVLAPLSVTAPTSVAFTGSSILTSYLSSFLLDGTRSQLIGYTSNFAPIIGNTTIVDGGSSANGRIITPTANFDQSILVPEPASLAIWGFGVFGLALFGLQRRAATAQ